MKELNFDHEKPIKRRMGRSGSQSNSAYMREYYHKNKYRGGEKAKQAVRRAIKKGILPSLKINRTRCEECRRCRATQYHHEDYNKPLEVRPVCASCNQFLGEAMEVNLI